MNSWQYRYDTGWINRSDWTNVHLGTTTTKNTDSNVTHNLNTPLANLLIEVFVSTDGTDANSVLLPFGLGYYTGVGYPGITAFAVDNNNIKVQTGDVGVWYHTDAGAVLLVDSEDYYYKVKVWYVG